MRRRGGEKSGDKRDSRSSVRSEDRRAIEVPALVLGATGRETRTRRILGKGVGGNCAVVVGKCKTETRSSTTKKGLGGRGLG